jgi:hypothetical protein
LKYAMRRGNCGRSLVVAFMNPSHPVSWPCGFKFLFFYISAPQDSEPVLF